MSPVYLFKKDFIFLKQLCTSDCTAIYTSNLKNIVINEEIKDSDLSFDKKNLGIKFNNKVNYYDSNANLIK